MSRAAGRAARGIEALTTRGLETNKATGFQQGTEIAVDQFVEHVIAMKSRSDTVQRSVRA